MIGGRFLAYILLTSTASIVSSHLGKFFLATCPESRLKTVDTEYTIHVTAPNVAAAITVTVPLRGVTLYSNTLLAGDVIEISLQQVYIIEGAGLSNNVVLVTSNETVSAYVSLVPDGDGYMVIPVESLNTEYYVVTYCQQSGTDVCQFTITASEHSTTISIHVSIQNTSASLLFDGATYKHGDIITETLTQYQTMQIQCNYDLTGTRVNSSKPVAVIGGSAGTAVGLGATTGTLLEQYPPVVTFGKEVLTIPSNFVMSVPGDYYRILFPNPLTTIEFGGKNRRLIMNAGDWFQTNISEALTISANKPIMVTRLTLGASTTPTNERPSMMILVPTEQLFTPPDKVLLPLSSLSDREIILVSKAPRHNATFLGNNLQSTNWTSVLGSNLVIKYTQYDNQVVSMENEDAAMAVYFQGNSANYSTSFVGGMKFLSTNPPCTPTETGLGDGVDNDCDGTIDEDTCPFSGTSTDYAGKDCKEIVSGERDFRGRRFVFVFPEHIDNNNQDDLHLILTALDENAITVKLLTPLRPSDLYQSLAFFKKTAVKLSDKYEVVGMGLSDKSIMIEASNEISLYTISNKHTGQFSSGASRILPVESLGTEYYAVTVCDGGLCQITIIAVHYDTKVQIKLKLNSENAMLEYNGTNYYNGDIITQSLIRYQVWQLQSIHDLTGSHVFSDKPISVISGSKNTYFIRNLNKDQISENLLPVSTWGRTFAVIQAPNRIGLPTCTDTCMDWIRIIASEAGTVVNITNPNGLNVSTHTFLYPGEWKDYVLNQTAYISSNRGISVNQLLQDGIQNFDTAFLTVIPIEQFAFADRIRLVSDLETNFNYYIVLITKNEFKTSIPFANSSVWVDFPVEMSHQTLEPTTSDLLLSTGNSSILFGGYIYGNRDFTSFIFNIASYLYRINTPCLITDMVAGDNVDNDCDGRVDEETCNEFTLDDGDHDGMFNEDCAEEIVSSSIISSSSSEFVSSSSSSIDISSSSELIASSSSSIEISSTDVLSTASSSTESSSLPSLDSSATHSESHIDTTISLSNEETATNSLTITPSVQPSMDSSEFFSVQPSSTEGTPESVPHKTDDVNSIGDNLPSMYILTSGDSMCTCGCITWSITTTLESESLVKVTKSIKKELTVDATEVSQTKRKYISVPDPRISAQTVGYFGVAMISCIFVGIFILDAGALFKDIVTLTQTLRDVIKK